MEEDAKCEIASILDSMGDDAPTIFITGMSGILEVSTSVEPSEFAGVVTRMVAEEPWSVRYIFRVIPIQKVVDSEISDIADACDGYRDVISSDRYRITVEKRHSGVSSQDLISAIADRIQGNVSLEEPSWIILVEVLGKKTGVSLLHPGDVVSVEKLKRML